MSSNKTNNNKIQLQIFEWMKTNELEELQKSLERSKDVDLEVKIYAGGIGGGGWTPDGIMLVGGYILLRILDGALGGIGEKIFGKLVSAIKSIVVREKVVFYIEYSYANFPSAIFEFRSKYSKTRNTDANISRMLKAIPNAVENYKYLCDEGVIDNLFSSSTYLVFYKYDKDVSKWRLSSLQNYDWVNV